MEKMKSVCGKFSLVGVIVAGFATCQIANASLTVNDAVGGQAFSGVNYANFDDLSLGNAGGTSGGVAVSFKPDAQVVAGGSSGVYAAPFLTPNNNLYFGDALASGPDSTRYLTAGSDGSSAGASVTLSFGKAENYLGLLWGSVDAYNTLSFYSGGNLVGSLTGSDVIANANGSQAADGTTYVNITGLTFDTVVATSSQYAFEFDNVAYGAVPEPTTIAAGALMLLPLGVSAMRIMRKSRVA